MDHSMPEAQEIEAHVFAAVQTTGILEKRL
jgi:hypothetical protein